jgi:tRNA U34 5-methylaminomethyl-2-thiouridine-forming methyltransferase MnmC
LLTENKFESVSKPHLVVTNDGSFTLSLPNTDEHYHSTHGAMQESMYVYIQQGLKQIQKTNLRLLEIGLGTGLNCLLTYNTFINNQHWQTIEYTALEPYPLEQQLIAQLGYTQLIDAKAADDVFMKVHQGNPGQQQRIADNFYFTKHEEKIHDMMLPNDRYDLIYFDAFGPRTQPEMWTFEVFKKLFDTLSNHGILVTYCAKGAVKRTLKSVGFLVESLPGPPGKREMTRAIKTV